jgi:stage IV sporulation protein FB
MFKIPIRVHPLFFLLAALIGWLSSQSFLLTLVWIGVVFVSVLVHEYGHAISGLLFGQHVMIHLTGFGGVTYRTGRKLKLWQDFIVVLAGPIFGFFLGCFSYLLLAIFPNIEAHVAFYALRISFMVNMFWTFLNLIPVQPLDGGKLLSILLEAILGFRGVRAGYFFSMVVCAALGFLFFYYSNILGGMIFLLLGFENYRSWNTTSAMSEEDQDINLWRKLKEGENLLAQGKLDAAEDLLKELSSRGTRGVIHVAAVQFLAETYLKKGNKQEAYNLLYPLKDQLSIEFGSMMQELAFDLGHYMLAIEMGTKVYQENPSFTIALYNAMSHAKLGEETPAIGWLKTAHSYTDPKLLDSLKQKHFDRIRSSQAFRELEEKIKTEGANH